MTFDEQQRLIREAVQPFVGAEFGLRGFPDQTFRVSPERMWHFHDGTDVQLVVEIRGTGALPLFEQFGRNTPEHLRTQITWCRR